MGNRWRQPMVAAAVAATLALAACTPTGRVTSAAPTPSAGTTTGDPPAGLTASLVQYRRDQPRRVVEVKLDNAGSRSLDVTLVDVTLPGYTPTGRVDRTTTLGADNRVDLPVPLGAPVCGDAPDGVATARIDVTAGGATIRSTVPVDDDGLLARLHGVDCATRRVEDVTDVTLDAWERRGAGRELTVAGEATVTMTAPEATVEITDVVGNLLFVVVPDTVTPAAPVRLDDAATSATIAFELLPSRCDGHAIAEAKRLTTIALVVSVDGAESVPLRLPPDDAGLEVLLTALRDRCDAL